nr:calcium-transporting ATPase 3, endoplasmic reticulum-type isoform X1 [Tanacetum cinerariifolium]
MRVNTGIDISRKAGEVPVAALNIKSEVDGAIEQDKSNTLTQSAVSDQSPHNFAEKDTLRCLALALKMMPKGHQSISLHDEKDVTFIR